MGDLNKAVVLKIAEGEYAIPISKVKEIINMEEITKIPDVPEYIEGIINLRGKINVIYNLRKKFKVDKDEENIEKQKSHFKIILIDQKDIGLMVDDVSEIIQFSEEDTEPVPDVREVLSKTFILNLIKIGKKAILNLDVDNILNSEEILELNEIKENVTIDTEKPQD